VAAKATAISIESLDKKPMANTQSLSSEMTLCWENIYTPRGLHTEAPFMPSFTSH